MSPDLSACRDDQLLQRVAQNSASAFEELYRRYQPTLFTRALHVLGCENTAKDCLQDVFVSVWTKRESLRVENLHNYLHQAVRFRALRWLEYGRLAGGREERPGRRADTYVPSDILEYKEFRNRFETLINALPADQRKIFLMHREKGMTYGEIAAQLQISPKTVEKKMSLALKALRHAKAVV